MYYLAIVFLCSLLVFKFLAACMEQKYINVTIWITAIFTFIFILDNAPIG